MSSSSLLATPPASRKRTRRTSSGTFLSRNDFRVLELVAPCPAIVRQTIKEAVFAATAVSAGIEPSGFAIIVTPTRLIVWNSLHPEQAPIALAFDSHDVDGEAVRRVALVFDENVLRAIVYSQKSGLVVYISVTGKQSRGHVTLHAGENVTALTLISATSCLLSTSRRLLQVQLGDRIQIDPITLHHAGSSVFRLVRTPPPTLPTYTRLICDSPMHILAISDHSIDELLADTATAFTIAWSATNILDDAVTASPGARHARIVDVAATPTRVAVLSATCIGPLDQLQFCIALYERNPQQPGLKLVHGAQLIESLEAESGEELRVELSDQDPALAFVYGRRILAVLDLASGVHDLVRFDDPTLLGGGRGRDHRGCFFVSVANGIICARLARGPTTAALAYADEAAPAQPPAGLYAAFTAFQQARIANCRALVQSLGPSGLDDDAVRISGGIIDAAGVPLQEKQSRHVAYVEFLKAMPGDGNVLWARLGRDTHREVRTHSDAVEIALAFDQILSAPPTQFHEVAPSARTAFDQVRMELVPEAARDAIFSTLTRLPDALCAIIADTSRIPESRRILALVVLCRLIRGAVTLEDAASWLQTAEARPALRALLADLREAVGSSNELVQDGFAYTNFFYVACVHLNGFLTQAQSSTLLDAEYASERSRLGRALLNLAQQADPSPRQRYALAFEFGERFADCTLLAELCERCAWPERSDAYAREFGDAYALACCATWYASRSYDKLLAHIGQPWLAQFVEDKPQLSWIVDLDQGNLALTSVKLHGLAQDEAAAPRLRCFFAAMAKLTGLQSDRMAELDAALDTLLSMCCKQ